jgi:hypothetical protein
MYKCSIQVHSHNHLCCGKEIIIITYLPYLPSMQNACVVLQCLWLVRLYNIFPHYLIISMTVRKISHFKKMGVEGRQTIIPQAHFFS